MKLRRSACIDTLYLELPFLDRFQAAKEDGFDAVEFWSWREYPTTPFLPLTMPTSELRRHASTHRDRYYANAFQYQAGFLRQDIP